MQRNACDKDEEDWAARAADLAACDEKDEEEGAAEAAESPASSPLPRTTSAAAVPGGAPAAEAAATVAATAGGVSAAGWSPWREISLSDPIGSIVVDKIKAVRWARGLL